MPFFQSILCMPLALQYYAMGHPITGHENLGVLYTLHWHVDVQRPGSMTIMYHITELNSIIQQSGSQGPITNTVLSIIHKVIQYRPIMLNQNLGGHNIIHCLKSDPDTFTIKHMGRTWPTMVNFLAKFIDEVVPKAELIQLRRKTKERHFKLKWIYLVVISLCCAISKFQPAASVHDDLQVCPLAGGKTHFHLLSNHSHNKYKSYEIISPNG
jgi:hypothetical protein